jgi:hypothetical protein
MPDHATTGWVEARFQSGRLLCAIGDPTLNPNPDEIGNNDLNSRTPIFLPSSEPVGSPLTSQTLARRPVPARRSLLLRVNAPDPSADTCRMVGHETGTLITVIRIELNRA